MTNQDRRERIIEAAYRVLSEQGYRAASIKAIARAAGVAPGLIHYYFASKEELLVEVLRAVSQRYTREIGALMAAVPADQLAGAGMGDVLRRVRQQPNDYRLRYELFALGLRDEALRRGARDLLEGGRSGIARIAASLGDAEVARPLASILLACFDGLALQSLVDPEFDLEEALDLLSRAAGAVL